MNFKEEDIIRGYKDCDLHGCAKRHILNAGMDYESWVKCDRCSSWVVDMEMEGELENFTNFTSTDSGK